MQIDEDELVRLAIEESKRDDVEEAIRISMQSGPSMDDSCLNEAMMNGFTLQQAREAQS
jgi:hypothetical protein